jgi:hypothetical protein
MGHCLKHSMGHCLRHSMGHCLRHSMRHCLRHSISNVKGTTAPAPLHLRPATPCGTSCCWPHVACGPPPTCPCHLPLQVRLPFTFTDMELQPLSFERACKISSTASLRARLTDPRVASRLPASAELPAAKSWVGSAAAGRCNDYLPASSVLDRYLWAVEYFVSNGFYVLVDYHPHLQEPQVGCCCCCCCCCHGWAA